MGCHSYLQKYKRKSIALGLDIWNNTKHWFYNPLHEQYITMGGLSGEPIHDLRLQIP